MNSIFILKVMCAQQTHGKLSNVHGLKGKMTSFHFLFSGSSENKVKYVAAAKSLTLCNPTDGSPPGSSAPRILQARILQWVAISFSNT